MPNSQLDQRFTIDDILLEKNEFRSNIDTKKTQIMNAAISPDENRPKTRNSSDQNDLIYDSELINQRAFDYPEEKLSSASKSQLQENDSSYSIVAQQSPYSQTTEENSQSAASVAIKNVFDERSLVNSDNENLGAVKSIKRSANFTLIEKDCLVKAISSYVSFIEPITAADMSNRYDGRPVKCALSRDAAWVEIEQAFKSLTESYSITRSRTIKNLKLCWKNMKAKARVDFLKTQKELKDLKQKAANQLTVESIMKSMSQNIAMKRSLSIIKLIPENYICQILPDAESCQNDHLDPRSAKSNREAKKMKMLAINSYPCGSDLDQLQECDIECDFSIKETCQPIAIDQIDEKNEMPNQIEIGNEVVRPLSSNNVSNLDPVSKYQAKMSKLEVIAEHKKLLIEQRSLQRQNFNYQLKILKQTMKYNSRIHTEKLKIIEMKRKLLKLQLDEKNRISKS